MMPIHIPQYRLVHLIDIGFLILIPQEIFLLVLFPQGSQVGSPPRNLLRNLPRNFLEDLGNLHHPIVPRTPGYGDCIQVGI